MFLSAYSPILSSNYFIVDHLRRGFFVFICSCLHMFDWSLLSLPLSLGVCAGARFTFGRGQPVMPGGLLGLSPFICCSRAFFFRLYTPHIFSRRNTTEYVSRQNGCCILPSCLEHQVENIK
ncbi:hypothetical protein BDD12DRAFT_339448 [Trichophaea hybrida]|nr:hypothetical protein BDD12DRAFT_339448 [Trichophaea hybrida]